MIESVAKIDIPENEKIIVCRVNTGNYSPYRLTTFKWPQNGGVRASGELGIYGVLLAPRDELPEHSFMYVKYGVFSLMKIPQFIIMEVDKRKAKIAYLEVEFREANILLKSDFNGFMSQMNKYVTYDIYNQIVKYLEPVSKWCGYIDELRKADAENGLYMDKQIRLDRFRREMQDEYMAVMRELIDKRESGLIT
jgi:hypothetical protein